MKPHTHPLPARRLAGFTLIEILIVVVVVGILSAIAYPSYISHVQRSLESEAQGQIVALAGALEAYRAKNFSYANASITNLAPQLDENEHYTSSLTLSNNNQSYTITATPQGSRMSGMPTLTYNSAGEASWDQP